METLLAELLGLLVWHSCGFAFAFGLVRFLGPTRV